MNTLRFNNWSSRVSALLLITLLILVPACDAPKTPGAPAESRDPGVEGIEKTEENGPVKITARVSPKEPRLSDTIIFDLTLRSDPEIEVKPPAFGKGIREFTIRDYVELPSKLEGGKRVRRFRYRLEAGQAGKLLIRSQRVEFVDNRTPVKDSGKRKFVSSPPLEINVTSNLGSNVPDLNNLAQMAEPVPIASNAWVSWLVGALAGGLVGGLAAWFAVRVLKKKSEVLIVRTPEEIARAELSALLDERLAERQEFKEFYVRLTGIVRRYIERKTGIHAPEQTTEEFLRDPATKRVFDDERARRLGQFLEAADMVKYAGQQPGGREIDESVERAREFIGDVIGTASDTGKRFGCDVNDIQRRKHEMILNGFQFHSPHWLLLLPLAAWVTWNARRPATRASVLYSNTSVLKGLPVTMAQRVKRVIPWLGAFGLMSMILALARPQLGSTESRINTEGIAIELVLDISGSMEAMDFRIDDRSSSRLNAVKHVVNAFVNGSKSEGLSGRRNDLVGLVAFGGFADSRCPLTLDHGALSEIVKSLEVPKPIVDRAGNVLNMEETQTAIGDGISAGINRLKDITAKSKILILLTDGDNNAGVVDPREAAKIASTFGIKVYTICIGTNDVVPFPVKDLFGNTVMDRRRFPIDEQLLKDIAETAHAKYYHAYGTEALTDVYKEIDKLEKSKVEETRYTEYTEYMAWLALPGLVLLMGVFVLEATRFRSLP